LTWRASAASMSAEVTRPRATSMSPSCMTGPIRVCVSFGFAELTLKKC
jgi:hypothetical protein